MLILHCSPAPVNVWGEGSPRHRMNDGRKRLSLLLPKFASGVPIALVLAAASLAADAAPRRDAEQKLASNATQQPNASDLAASVVHHGDGVAAIVNDSVISDYDLRQRMARGAGDHDGVAVRRGLRHEVAAEHAGGAGLVVDHDRLTQRLGNFLGDDARHAARRRR